MSEAEIAALIGAGGSGTVFLLAFLRLVMRFGALTKQVGDWLATHERVSAAALHHYATEERHQDAMEVHTARIEQHLRVLSGVPQEPVTGNTPTGPISIRRP